MKPVFMRAVVIYVFAFVFLFAARPLDDPDFWWHLKTGEYIVNTKTIPKTDFFSFTNAGKEWVAHEWLSEAIFYVIYSWAGFAGLILIFAALGTIAFWIVFRRSSAHALINGGAVILGVWTVLSTIGVRPRVFTMLLASIYLSALGRYLREGGKAPWWLVPIMIFWVNLHGGFVLGFVLIGMALAGVLFNDWVAGKPLLASRTQLRALMLILGGSLLAALLNPTGARIFSFPFEIFFSPVQQREVNDWLSPNFHDLTWQPLVILILATVAAIALSPKKPRPSDVLLFLVTLYATLKSRRHVAIFALIAVPLLSDGLQSWLASTPLTEYFRGLEASTRTRRDTLFLLLLLLPLIVFAPKLRSVVFDPPSQEQVKVPIKAVEHMKARGINGNTFTDPNIWGGYLIWEIPSSPVYIDGRIDMYGDEFVSEYIDIGRGLIDWRVPFDRHRVQIVLVEPNARLAREFRAAPDWQNIYEDNFSVAFARR